VLVAVAVAISIALTQVPGPSDPHRVTLGSVGVGSANGNAAAEGGSRPAPAGGDPSPRRQQPPPPGNATEGQVPPGNGTEGQVPPGNGTEGQVPPAGANRPPAAPPEATVTETPVPPAPPLPSSPEVAPSTTSGPAKAPPTKVPPSTSARELAYVFQAQPDESYCGPAATRIALSVSGRTPSLDEVATHLGITVNGTGSAQDTTRALNDMLGASRYTTRVIPGGAVEAAVADQFRADAVAAISNDRAVVASVVGSVMDDAGAWHGYAHSHYVTVVGYRDGGAAVKVVDPAGTGDPYWVTTTRMAQWMATRGYSY
jgi:hypothetical protein